MMEQLLTNYTYYVFIILMMIGLWAMISKRNLVKKVIGMAIFQTAIILFFISIGVKRGASIPILETGHHDAAHHAVNIFHYANPLPHVLMLTAIVVGVATLGLALAVIQNVYKEHGTIEEDEILEKVKT